jgi:protein involved in polysaccharide export with SLBB domain
MDLSRRAVRRWRTLVSALVLMLAAVAPLAAQQGLPGGLTPSQLEALRRNPELVRQQIQQSGLTPDQIRARLRAAGYPENVLDAYLAGGQTGLGAPTPSTAALSALEALGLPFQMADALLPPDTGRVEQRMARSRVFGVDAFRRSTTQFLPLLAGPVPPDYRLGPGDMLVLILTGDVELTHTLSVSRDGFVLIPQVGQVPVTNLTLEQLRDVLYTRLGRVYSGVRRGTNATTQFDVSVANVRANQVYVAGDVVQPGAYQLSALGTVLTALYAAGGITEDGSVRRVEIRRLGQLVDSLDLYDYLLRGDVRGDVRLETGDVVFVPVRGSRVEVAGAVVRPAIYETNGRETVADVIRAAGGLRPNADLKALTVFRFLRAAERGPGPAPRAAISVPLVVQAGAQDLGPGAGVTIPDFEVRDGDSVVAHPLPPLDQTHYVDIAGMVVRPGRYPWASGISLRDLLQAAGGPRVGADLRDAEVARMPADRSGGTLADTIRVPMDSSYLADRQADGSYAAPPGPAFPAAGTAAEFRLEPYDQVLIRLQPEFEFQRSVAILGEVRLPGIYALTRKDTRLSDLVQRAGGFLDGAYPQGGRFYRLFQYSGLGDAGQRRAAADTALGVQLPKDRDQVNVDLAAALAAPGSAADIMLQPGDSVYIPEYLPTVRVSGAVVAPASVQYVAGKDATYYLQNAGGFAESADKGRTVVRQANGSAKTRSKFLFWSNWPEPGPGAEVFVPAKTPKPEGTNWLPILAAMASIIASTASIVIAASP